MSNIDNIRDKNDNELLEELSSLNGEPEATFTRVDLD